MFLYSKPRDQNHSHLTPLKLACVAETNLCDQKAAASCQKYQSLASFPGFPDARDPLLVPGPSGRFRVPRQGRGGRRQI
jgi:hypothetical protein